MTRTVIVVVCRWGGLTKTQSNNSALTQKLFPAGIINLNDNNTYFPKEDIMSKWTAIPERNEDGSFSLCLTYEVDTT